VALAQLSRERRFRPGADIVRQGDPAEHFYIVTAGQVEVLHQDEDASRSIGRFGAGFHFGEIALLDQKFRTATVQATTPTRVLELSAQAFRRHLMDIPATRYRLARIAAERKAQLLTPPLETRG
jgi:CRP-like cAMP-binding protein